MRQDPCYLVKLAIMSLLLLLLLFVLNRMKCEVVVVV
jgi:hypothetical protein